MQWIKCRDKLPDKITDERSAFVLVAHNNETSIACFDYYDNVWKEADEWGVDNVTHWMPLPKLPKPIEPPKHKERERRGRLCRTEFGDGSFWEWYDDRDNY